MMRRALLLILLLWAAIVPGCQGRHVEFVSNRPIEPPEAHREALTKGVSNPDTVTVCIAEARAVQNGMVVWLSVAGMPATTITDFDSITLSQALAGYIELSVHAFDVMDSTGKPVAIESPDPHESNWPELSRVREFYRCSMWGSTGPQFSPGQFVHAPTTTDTPGVFSQMLFLYCRTNLDGASISLGTSQTSLEAVRHVEKRIQSELESPSGIIVLPNRVHVRPL